jgi:signal transduction histidine kinase
VASPVAAPTRLRRRLTVAFVLVAGTLTFVLAATTYLLVREARLSESLERAEREARFGLRLAADLGTGADLRQFVESFEGRGVHAVLIEEDRRFVSNPSVDPAISQDLRSLVDEGELAFERADVAGSPHLVVGGRPPGSTAELYLLISEEGMMRDLGQLGTLLSAGWLATVVVSALVGWLVARRTLAPVGRASRAARDLAEGLLDTRLPASGTDEFGVWAASFNQMAEALQAKIDDLTQARSRERRFTADVAHELRTPLTAIVSEASMLAEHLDRLPPEASRPAQLLIGDVARLRRLVEDLMTIARFDSGREDVREDGLELSALVEATIRSRGWSDLVSVDAEPVRMNGDRRRIETIVANLVANAVEHGGRDVAVRIRPGSSEATVEVSDHGPGIGPEHLPHVFDRFYKGDRARTGGSGLGLAIALENARLLGGDLDVWSVPGRGARLTLRLPVAQPLHGGDGAVASADQDGRTSIKEASTDEADPDPVHGPDVAGDGVR